MEFYVILQHLYSARYFLQNVALGISERLTLVVGARFRAERWTLDTVAEKRRRLNVLVRAMFDCQERTV